MQQKRGNFSTRGTFSRQFQQQTRPTTQRQTGNTVGPSGAAANLDLMPVGGFQSNAGRGRSRPTLNRGAPGFRGNFSNRGTQQNIQSQRSNNRNEAVNRLPAQRGQGMQTQDNRGRPVGRGNTHAQLHNNYQDNGLGRSFDNQGIASNMYQIGPYGDSNMFGQVPWNQEQHGLTNFNNNIRMVTPYTNTQAHYSNNLYPHQISNQPFNVFGGNAEIQSQNMTVNNRGGMHQTPLSGGYHGKMNMLPTNSWMDETSFLSNEWNNTSSRDTDGFNTTVVMDTNLAHAVKTNEPTAKQKKSGKTAVGELKKSLHLFTGDIAKIKQWSMYKDSIQMMFQFYGQLDSAVSRSDASSKSFLIKDERNNTMKCVFYEIDRLIPKLTRGQWYRIVGTYDSSKGHFTCLSVRQMMTEETNLMCVLSNKSSEVMKKLILTAHEV